MPATTYLQVPFTTSAPGNFTLAHTLGKTPAGAKALMTSSGGGEVWFQSTLFDAANLYLVASDAGITGVVQLWG